MIDHDAVLGRVRAALSQVKNPATGQDIVSSGQVQELGIGPDGHVRFRFSLGPNDPGTLVREARSAAEAAAGAMKVRIDVKLPKVIQPAAAQGRPVKPGTVPAPTPDPNLIQGIRHVIAISSGKGGVGKSTVAANLAAALAASGKRVGLLDADVYGPNIPLMFGEKRRPTITGER